MPYRIALATGHFLDVLGYRAPRIATCEAALSISRRSSDVSSIATEPMFSSRRDNLVDRLSREVRELAQMVDDLAKHGVILNSITEPFDTANAAGKMMLQMLGVFAEFEHATIVERTKVGMEKRPRAANSWAETSPTASRLIRARAS